MNLLDSCCLRTITRALPGLATCPVVAHEVWIEDKPDGRRFVRFAGYGEKSEQSPGALDALTLPFAWTPGKEVAKEETGGGKEARDRQNTATMGQPMSDPRVLRLRS